MQVLNPNNIKIYNISGTVSVPEWLSDRKKRQLQKNDSVRRRIQLIQDFSMPTISNTVMVTKDRRYIIASGLYKPRIRCYEMDQLCMKFERCLDAEVVQLLALSDDYTKLAMLETERYIEFHSQFGRYYRTRIPYPGRDMAYHEASCDLYIVGASKNVVRLNLELGRFMLPLTTASTEVCCCQFNNEHGLFACGTVDGCVECWDPRSHNRVGKVDTMHHIPDESSSGLAEVSCVTYKDAMNLAVGTSTGQVLLYDIRSSKPFLIKDHHYGLPIKDIVFHHNQDLVLSMDQRIVKIWNCNFGELFTSIDPGVDINNLCCFPQSGLLFLANESENILSYYIPALGTAPKFCGFLDNLTEELEEAPSTEVYDDYKFVTRTELEALGLSHLIGTSLLKAYMHGYFLDMRLYKKAKSITEPFAYDKYRQEKIKERLQEECQNRVRVVKGLPKVNRVLATKLIEAAEVSDAQELKKKGKKKAMKSATNLLKDERFAAMFENPDFQVDMESVEYQLAHPAISKLDARQLAKSKKTMDNESEELRKESDHYAEIGGSNSDSDDGEDTSSAQSEDSDTDIDTMAKRNSSRHRFASSKNKRHVPATKKSKIINKKRPKVARASFKKRGMQRPRRQL